MGESGEQDVYSAVGANEFKFRGGSIELGGWPIVMGVLNVTPDSFSDGGAFVEVDSALAQVERMLEEGARIIDVGGESTRPDAVKVGADEEGRRVAPIVRAIVERFPDAIISVDTVKTAVAQMALDEGAHLVNDVSGLGDVGMADLIAQFEAGCVLMFNARSMGIGESIVDSIRSGWRKSLELAAAAGIDRQRIVLDPGIGFGTSREQDLDILRGLRDLKSEGYPLLLGTSRKRITGDLLGLDVGDRYETTLATTVVGVEQGVEFFRVHDVAGNVKASRMAQLIYAK